MTSDFCPPRRQDGRGPRHCLLTVTCAQVQLAASTEGVPLDATPKYPQIALGQRLCGYISCSACPKKKLAPRPESCSDSSECQHFHDQTASKRSAPSWRTMMGLGCGRTLTSSFSASFKSPGGIRILVQDIRRAADSFILQNSSPRLN